MLSVQESKKSRTNKKNKEVSLYNKIIINRNVQIPMIKIGSNLKDNILKLIENSISGKCIDEGFIKPNSISIISHSNGKLEDNFVKFEVVIECLACNPVEGEIINCIAKNITKAGIRAEIDDEYNPLIIFVARDHSYLNKKFSSIKENEHIMIRVIGQRYELNDKSISIIGDIIDTKGKQKELDINDSISLDINDVKEI